VVVHLTVCQWAERAPRHRPGADPHRRRRGRNRSAVAMDLGCAGRGWPWRSDCSSSAWVGLVVMDVGSCNFLRCADYLLGFS